MVHARRGHRRLRVHAEVRHVEQRLEHAGEDGRATRRAERGDHASVAQQQRRRHRRQHAFAGRDLVGAPADHPVEVRLPRTGAEVVHLVVEQEAGARHHHAVAEAAVERVGERDRAACAVDDREVRGLRAVLEAGPHRRQRRGQDAHLRRPSRDVGGIDERRRGHRHEVRVAEVLGAVGEHALHHLGEQVQISRGVVPESGERRRQRLAHAEQLRECDAAGARRRRGDDGLPAPHEAQRFAPRRPVTGEVGGADEPAAAAHLGDDQVGGATAVEAVGPVRGDALERARESGLPPALTGDDAAEVRREVRASGELGALIAHALGELRVDHEALAREADGRRQQRAPRQRAVSLMGRPETGDRARHAGGARADEARVRDRLAGRVEVHVAGRRRGRGLAEVEEGLFAVDVQREEAAAAEVAGLRVGDGECERGGDRGVDGVAAAAQHIARDLGAGSVRDGDRGDARTRRRGRPGRADRSGVDGEEAEADRERGAERGSRATGERRAAGERFHGDIRRRSSMWAATVAMSRSWSSSRQGSASAAAYQSRIAGSISRRAA